MGGSTAFLIAEKPTAAKRIAQALDEGASPEKVKGKVFEYYVAGRKGDKIIVCPALGHLYSLVDARGDKSVFPALALNWVPKYVAERGAKKFEAWIEELSRLSGDASEFVNACDYDLEGSLIGSLILKYACGGKDAVAKRMRYSTLTKGEIISSYENMQSELDGSLIEAGRARHEIDFLFGVNLSRFLTVSHKKGGGSYATISVGRVQSPALSFVVQRDREVKTFVPIPSFEIDAAFSVGGELLEAQYRGGVFDRLVDAEKLVSECKGKKGAVSEVKERKRKRNPPIPFNVGAFQRAAYSLFRLSPARSMGILERLYLDALVSYPRTSSQKLPAALNIKEKLQQLSEQKAYSSLAKELVKAGRFEPRQGKKDDPAHPAIHPTGAKPERKLSLMEGKVYDLVVKRFFAVLAEPAVMKSIGVMVDVKGNLFRIRGLSVVDEGWTRFYKPYTKTSEKILPPMKVGQKIKLAEIKSVTKYASSPSSYNQGSLLKAMEDNGIGTKATRTGIIGTLHQRRYVIGDPMMVTPLGYGVADLLKRFSPLVVSVEMTRDLEGKMNDIEEGKASRHEVMIESAELLLKILEESKKHQAAVGEELVSTVARTRLEARTLGSCPVCKTGMLRITRSRKTRKRFAGCSNYWEGKCTASAPLPQRGRVSSTGKLCDECGWPKVQVRTKGRRPWVFCLSADCPSKVKKEVEKPVEAVEEKVEQVVKDEV